MKSCIVFLIKLFSVFGLAVLLFVVVPDVSNNITYKPCTVDMVIIGTESGTHVTYPYGRHTWYVTMLRDTYTNIQMSLYGEDLYHVAKEHEGKSLSVNYTQVLYKEEPLRTVNITGIPSWYDDKEPVSVSRLELYEAAK